MNHIVPSTTLTLRIYSLAVFLALMACIYAFLKPGISSPDFPEIRMKKALNEIGTESLISTSKTVLNKDSSDRTVSPLHTYRYSAGSKVLAAMVRVKKRDDFKIETYGLLTKNIDQIYLKNSNVLLSIPPSLHGMIGKDKYIQTCVVPKTTNVEESDFRLDNLTTIVEKLNPASDRLLDKIMGTKKHIDYSCLVLTYKPANNSVRMPPENWTKIIKNVQAALSP
jgi:hypothetical protein